MLTLIGFLVLTIYLSLIEDTRTNLHVLTSTDSFWSPQLVMCNKKTISAMSTLIRFQVIALYSISLIEDPRANLLLLTSAESFWCPQLVMWKKY